jgi:hypothetical protein
MIVGVGRLAPVARRGQSLGLQLLGAGAPTVYVLTIRVAALPRHRLDDRQIPMRPPREGVKPGGV